MIASELLDIENGILELAGDIEDRDQWHDHADSCAKLRALARRIAVQAETAKLKAAA